MDSGLEKDLAPTPKSKLKFWKEALNLERSKLTKNGLKWCLDRNPNPNKKAQPSPNPNLIKFLIHN